MTAAIPLQTFNQFAIAHRFTGVQTQLWQCLYWLVVQYGQDVCIPTYYLLDTMGISRSQLSRARNALVQAGCLQIRKANAQRTHYTVMIDGETVGAGAKPLRNDVKKTPRDAGGKTPRDVESPSPTKNNDKYAGGQTPPLRKTTPHQSVPTGVAKQPDVIMNRQVESLVDGFVAQHGYSCLVRNKLLQWCDMRRQHHWTLTATGFASTMDTLLEHSGGDEELMLKIIDRTLRHRWKGFFEYKIDPIPREKTVVGAGSARPNTWGASNGGPYKQSSGKIPKYDTKKEDLDFLEW